MHLELRETVGRGEPESELEDLTSELSPTFTNPPQLRTKSRALRFFSALRSIMASWVDEKSAARLGNGGGYFPIPDGVGTELAQDIASLPHPQKASKKRSQCSYAMICGLVIGYVHGDAPSPHLLQQC